MNESVFVAYYAFYEDWGLLGVYGSFDEAQARLKSAGLRSGRLGCIDEYGLGEAKPRREWRFESDGVTPSDE